jgi:hypothetical protein
MLMAIVKRKTENVEGYTPFQLGIISILDDYDYHILDMRYIEAYKQIVVTIAGLVIFITPTDVSISFEITTTPDQVGNFILILAETIDPKAIHITDSFIITRDDKGQKIAVFGPDAQAAYENDLVAQERYNNGYMKILTSPNVKFFNC